VAQRVCPIPTLPVTLSKSSVFSEILPTFYIKRANHSKHKHHNYHNRDILIFLIPKNNRKRSFRANVTNNTTHNYFVKRLIILLGTKITFLIASPSNHLIIFDFSLRHLKFALGLILLLLLIYLLLYH